MIDYINIILKAKFYSRDLIKTDLIKKCKITRLMQKKQSTIHLKSIFLSIPICIIFE